MHQPIRISLIDHRRFFTEAIALMLRHHEGFDLAEPLISANETFLTCPLNWPDVLLVDASMKGPYVTQYIQKIKELAPHVKIIVYGLEDEKSDAVSFIEAGAIGCLLKEQSFIDLLNMIKATQEEQAICLPTLAASVFARISELSKEQYRYRPASHLDLTEREKDVLFLLAKGLSNKEIGLRLHISPSTVKNHMHNILAKFGVHYRRELIQRASECGCLRERELGWPLVGAAHARAGEGRE